MNVLFALAPEITDPMYKSGVLDLARRDVHATFFDDAPLDDLKGWIGAQQLELAFFDVSTCHPNVLVAFGLALEVGLKCFALRDGDKAWDYGQSTVLGEVRQYFGADDFQRKANKIIIEVQGWPEAERRELAAQIKMKIKTMGQPSMKEIAKKLGRNPEKVREVVYELVRAQELIKISDKRWARYQVPNCREQ